jgi:hypothetical protein
MLFIGNGGISVKVDEATARSIVYHYRNEYPEIPKLWSLGEIFLHEIVAIAGRRQLFGRLTDRERSQLPVRAGFDALWGPSDHGLCISYPELDWRVQPDGSRELSYSNGHGGWIKIYGAKCIENISQWLSRIIIMDAAVRVYNTTRYNPFLSTHDSLDYCVPESEAEEFDKILAREFAVTPGWAVGLPLASKGGWGVSLLDAERGVGN